MRKKGQSAYAREWERTAEAKTNGLKRALLAVAVGILSELEVEWMRIELPRVQVRARRKPRSQ